MRKVNIFLLSVLLMWCLSIPSFAGEATISTVVPDSHIITVSGDGADVFCDNQSGTRFEVPRLSEPRLLIRAISGKKITKIELNGVDITEEIKGGYYTLKPVFEEQTLAVSTEDVPEPQGKTYTLQGTVIQNGKPVEGITVELRSTLKTTVTDKNGRYVFYHVTCGKHSMTMISSGQIVAYTELTVQENNKSGVQYSDGQYQVKVNNNSAGINLKLELMGDGTCSVAGVSDVVVNRPVEIYNANTNDTQQKTGTIESGFAGTLSLPTGDNANAGLWIVFLIVSATALTAAFIWKKKQGKN